MNHESGEGHSGDDQLSAARQLAAAGALVEAESAYRLAISTQDPDAYIELGAILRRLGRVSDAEELYRAALDASVIDALIPYGNLLAEIPGREEEAIDRYREALRNDDQFAHVNLAITLDKLGRSAEAEEEFRRALEADDPLARRNYGIFLYEHERYSEAESMLESALSLGDLKAHVDLANVLADTGRIHDAESHYLTAIKSDAAPRIAHEAYARLLRELGRDDEAREQTRLAEKD